MAEYLDCNLISLAFWYLIRKQRTTHIEYTIADLFDAANQILEWANNNGEAGHGNGAKLKFENGVTVYDKK
mgnify:CR=1 FL=1